MSEDIKQATVVHCPSCHKEYDVPFRGITKVFVMCQMCVMNQYGEYKSDN